MGFKVTLEKFIDRSNIIHNNKYDYSNSVYINNKIPIVIICKEHGEFEQLPSNHLNGSGCKDCFFDKKRNDVKYFINLSKKIHKGKYLYDLVKYKSNVDSGVFNAIQYAAAKALKNYNELIRENNAIYNRRRQKVHSLLEKIGLSYFKSDNTIYV